MKELEIIGGRLDGNYAQYRATGPLGVRFFVSSAAPKDRVLIMKQEEINGVPVLKHVCEIPNAVESK